MIWENWKFRWQKALTGCERIGGEIRKLKIKPKATDAEVLSVENKLGFRLPEDFRQILTEFSSSIEFNWYLPDIKLPDGLREIGSGECFWDLNRLIDFEAGRKGWIESCLEDFDEEYDLDVWNNKLVFLYVCNGDQIALDLNKLPGAPVVYLSHEGDEFHGYILGNSFTDFMERWSLLGCVGSEGWQMLQFMSSPTSGLEPHSEKAQMWREWLGLDFR